MSNAVFLPEGALIHTDQNLKLLSTAEMLRYAMENEVIVEGLALMCDASHNLIVDMNGYTGIIPHKETALGIDDGQTREIAIISRVGKPVACVICGINETDGKTTLLLSRRKAQKKARAAIFESLCPGDIIPVTVTHLEPFGAFVDIGCGNISLIGIESLSVSRISHTKDRFAQGDKIFAVVSGIDNENQRVFLSHRELLGTWEENAAKFEPGQTVRGIVRGIEDYGAFVELAPNLSGLAEYCDGLNIGDTVSVFIKSIIPEKMKIKLIIIDILGKSFKRYITQDDYFLTGGHIDFWRYSPESCRTKLLLSRFGEE